MSRPHLEVEQLSKAYPGGRGLLPLTMAVERGELVGIVGHNGAGKSTLLKMLAHWLRPDGGSAWIDGSPLADRVACVRKVGFVPETPNLYEAFSVEYNLTLHARLLGLSKARVAEVLSEFDLNAYRHRQVQGLSKGLKQRVSLGRSLLASPSLLLFDEPTSGLDYATSKDFYARLQALHAARNTILFTSHRPEELAMLATRVVVLHDGAVVFDGAPTAYVDSPSYRDLYQ